jgi:hypothetical protein
MTSAKRLHDWYGVDVTDPLGWFVAIVVAVVMLVPLDAPLWLALLAGLATVGSKAVAEAYVAQSALATEARTQVLRARQARKRTLKTIRRGAKDGAISAPGAISNEVDLVVDEVHGAASRMTRVAEARDRIDVPALERGRRQLAQQLPTTGRHAVHVERALAAIDDQVVVRARLSEAYQRLRAKTEAAVLGIERLDAQVSEIAAMHHTLGSADFSQELLGSTSAELEALREALDEADNLFEDEVRLEGDDLRKPVT